MEWVIKSNIRILNHHCKREFRDILQIHSPKYNIFHNIDSTIDNEKHTNKQPIKAIYCPYQLIPPSTSNIIHINQRTIQQHTGTAQRLQAALDLPYLLDKG